MTQKYIIFDLDNCLSNDSWRIPQIDWSQSDPGKRYANYHKNCALDMPGNYLAYLHALRANNAQPIFLTARPLSARQDTQRWLERCLDVSDAILMMRNEGDHRPSKELKRSMLDQLLEYNVQWHQIVRAYDDREDIVSMYKECGIPGEVMKIHDTCAYTPPFSFNIAPEPAPEPVKPKIAADILLEMAETYRARNAVYGDNFKMVARLMEVLFPGGVPEGLVFQDQFHLFELILVKLSRYAISGLTHIDSVHDLSVYGAMCEAINHNQPKGKS